MKTYLLAAALVGLTFTSQAQEQQGAGKLAPFLGIGLTLGGDKLGTVYFQNSGSKDLYAGRMIDLRAGLEYQVPESPLSFQTSISYHADTVAASNGDVSFVRYPLEVLAHYRVNESWRFGGGLRKALSPALKVSGDISGGGDNFNSSAGFVLEGEVMFGPNIGLKIRGVSEKYKYKDYGSESIDGSHIGVIGVYYFK